MADPSNNVALTDFLAKQWAQPEYCIIIGARVIYVTNGPDCIRLHSDGTCIFSEPVPQLHCTHVKCDTRILVHATHIAQEGHLDVVIRATDTDIDVLAIAFQSEITSRLLIHKCGSVRSHFIDIRAIRDSLGDEVCNALPGLHAITGCDSTSAFVGKGKKKAFDIISSVSAHRNEMQDGSRTTFYHYRGHL